MKHLENITLNEYLDHALDVPGHKAAAAHLETCTACRTKLDELKLVFSELDALSEIQLEHDLTPSVLKDIKSKAHINVWTRAFAAQVGVALGVMFWIAMQAIPYASISQVELPIIPALTVQTLLTRLFSIHIVFPGFQIPTFSYQLPAINIQMPTINFDFSNTYLIATAFSTLLLWVVGNVLLLRNRREVQL